MANFVARTRAKLLRHRSTPDGHRTRSNGDTPCMAKYSRQPRLHTSTRTSRRHELATSHSSGARYGALCKRPTTDQHAALSLPVKAASGMLATKSNNAPGWLIHVVLLRYDPWRWATTADLPCTTPSTYTRLTKPFTGRFAADSTSAASATRQPLQARLQCASASSCTARASARLCTSTTASLALPKSMSTARHRPPPGTASLSSCARIHWLKWMVQGTPLRIGHTQTTSGTSRALHEETAQAFVGQ